MRRAAHAVTQVQVCLCRFEWGMRCPPLGMRISAAHELGDVLSGRLRIDTTEACYDVQHCDMPTTSPAKEHSTRAPEDS